MFFDRSLGWDPLDYLYFREYAFLYTYHSNKYFGFWTLFGVTGRSSLQELS